MGFNTHTPLGMYFTCCKDCPDRHPACHGTCEKYKAAKAKYREYQDRESVDTRANAYNARRCAMIAEIRRKKDNGRKRYRYK